MQNTSEREKKSDAVAENSASGNLVQRVQARLHFWKQLFTVTVLASYLYIVMEWAFLVTMPSFMSIMNFPSRLQIMLISGLGFSIFWMAVLAGFILVDIIALVGHFSKVTAYIGGLIPSLILAALALLMLDNFIYTIFKFGISTSSGVVRGVYAGIFILLAVYIYIQVIKILGVRDTRLKSGKVTQRLFISSLIILVLSIGIALVNLDYAHLVSASAATQGRQDKKLPNIILLGSDGLNAQNLSAYGYRRSTTPQLAELAKTSLVAENAFTNAGNTAGSVISILTSKLPTATRVLYPPNILSGVNSYEHLPGLLKELGYQTIEFGVPYYVDAYNYNLQNGFDVVNYRTLSVGKLGDLGRQLGYDEEVYFLSRLIWRISDRLLHIFYVKEMQNPFDIVTHSVVSYSDLSKIYQIEAAVDQADAPVFIHAHLLGTHGGYYNPPNQLFSIGKSQDVPWMDDFYDDTLRAFDSYLGTLIYNLKKDGKFENTILIIYTDHNKAFKVNERIPLIIHFPGGDHAGRVTWNVENLDIAPTIVDYLGLSIPGWMEGKSLLRGNPGERLIFSTGTSETKPNNDQIEFLDASLIQPPFYQFSFINVIDCQNWYSLDLNTFDWSFGPIPGYVAPCDPNSLPTMDGIKQLVYDRLRQDGFDVSSLP